MHFRAEHRFGAPPPQVAAVLLDASFYASLELPDVGPAELVTVGPSDLASSGSGPAGSGGAHLVVVRYEYTGELDPLARGLLRGSSLAWTQTLRLEGVAPDGRSFDGSLEIDTGAGRSLLRARADVHLEADGTSGTRRIVDGELVVSLPGVGRVAERRIVPGVLRRLDVEAEALVHRLG